MLFKKSLILILCVLISASIYCADKIGDTPRSGDNTQDKSSRIKLTNLEIFRISYWSTFGVTGLTSIITSFAEMGHAYSVSNELNSIASDLEIYNADTTILRSFAAYYPGVVFGINFLAGGFAFIPVTGGIVYGASLYMAAIALCAVNALNVFNVSVTYGGANITSYTQRLRDAYAKMLDPTSYFVVGSVSIILGVAEIILWIYYNRELKRSKFPYNQRRFAFSPGSMSFSIFL